MQKPPSHGAGGTGEVRPSSATISTTPNQADQTQAGAAGAAANELKADAQQLGSKAANRLHSELDARKGTAATQAKTLSSALDRAAGGLDEGAPEWLKSAFRQGADQVQRFAESIERKDSRELMRNVESFARERPGMFLAACAAAGFAAARIFKAGGDAQSSRQSYSPQSSFDEPSFGTSDSDRSFNPGSRGELV